MMKIFKIIFTSLIILLLIGIAGIFIFLQTFDANRFKPQIISAARDALGRAVDFDDIALRLSLSKGLELSLKQLRISDSTGFQNKDFLRVDSISLGVEVMPLLKKRQILVSSININSPECIIIRREDGLFNLQDLGKSASFKQGSADSSGTIVAVQAAAGIPLVFAKTILLSGGKVTYIDRLLEPEFILDISQLRLRIEDFSLKDTFAFIIEGSVFSEQNNLRVEGKIRLDLAGSKVSLSDLTITTDLSDLSLARLESSLAMLKGVELPEQLGGRINASITKIEVTREGLAPFNISVELSAGLVKYKQLARAFSPIEAEFKITESRIRIRQLSLGLDKGMIEVGGELDDYTAAQQFNFKADIQDLDLAKIFDQKAQPVKIEGLFAADFTAQGSGFTLESLKESLLGEGSLEIKKGKLLDINVLKIVLSKISMIPNLVEKIQANLPERYKEKLKQKDTVITKAKANLAVANGIAMLEEVGVEAEGFIFSGRGKADFSGQFSLAGSFFIPADLAASMVKAVPELQYLLEETGEIRIPLQAAGKAGDIKFSVDLEYITGKIIKKKASEELGKALDKVFNRKSQPEEEPDSDTADTDTPPAKQERPLEQELIENVFDLIFK